MPSDSTRDPLLGSLLDGRYLVSKLLGQGGMGNVYLAEETRLRRRCALKVLHPKLAEDRTNVERFLREAQTIAQLEHPNIVDIYAYGEEASGVVWFAMELLVGEDLDARLRARAERPFTSHECCAWGIQIAQAVAVVHDAGLIHRDLKASNIFLARRRDGEEIVKLLDFGIARPEEGSELTATGITLGTPSYMSPEQVQNKVVDRRSDIYSFGVLLFKLLTNRLPFTGEPIQVAMAHCTASVPVPSVIAPAAGISPAMDALVLRTMEKDPARRYLSMRELERALRAVLDAEAPELAPIARSSRLSAPMPVAQTPAVSPVLAPRSIADTATPTGPTQAMDPTAPLPVQVPRKSGRWLYISTGVSILGVVLLLAVAMRRSADEPITSLEVAAPPTLREPVLAPLRPPAPRVSAEPVEPVEPGVVPNQQPAASITAAVPPTPEPEPTPPRPTAEKPKQKVSATPLDPLARLESRARACRRKHGKVEGPKIVINYAVDSHGRVERSLAETAGALEECLGNAVLSTRFEAKARFGKIAL